MRARIGIDDHARIQQVVRIGQLLQPPHDFIAFASPLCFDKGSHVAARAMLGLQRAIVAIDNDFHHVVDEPRVLIDGSLVVETLCDYEVQVSVLGVAEDDGVVVVVLDGRAYSGRARHRPAVRWEMRHLR